jgi:hypothetical protein
MTVKQKKREKVVRTVKDESKHSGVDLQPVCGNSFKSKIRKLLPW